jgi:phosphohistidine phosphatase
MKRLLLLRHAKSGWDDPAMRDFDRGLTERGQRAASRMGRLLAEEPLPDLVISSPAARTRQTIEGLERGIGAPLDALFDERIYLATMDSLLELIRNFDDSRSTALVIGHNPGLEDLALALTSGGKLADRVALAQKFPTAALADLELAVDSWTQVMPGTGKLNRFVHPRQLDTTLGDD